MLIDWVVRDVFVSVSGEPTTTSELAMFSTFILGCALPWVRVKSLFWMGYSTVRLSVPLLNHLAFGAEPPGVTEPVVNAAGGVVSRKNALVSTTLPTRFPARSLALTRTVIFPV